jgi:hypothetical protein
MPFSAIDDSRIETRFVWGRCAAKDARAIRDLIRAFQSDGWPESRPQGHHRQETQRASGRH